MKGHYHNDSGGTQNQGNSLGDRSCIRQSKLFRQYESGNDMKCLLGTANLQWKTNMTEGVYKGKQTYDSENSAMQSGFSNVYLKDVKYSNKSISSSVPISGNYAYKFSDYNSEVSGSPTTRTKSNRMVNSGKYSLDNNYSPIKETIAREVLQGTIGGAALYNNNYPSIRDNSISELKYNQPYTSSDDGNGNITTHLNVLIRNPSITATKRKHDPEVHCSYVESNFKNIIENTKVAKDMYTRHARTNGSYDIITGLMK